MAELISYVHSRVQLSCVIEMDMTLYSLASVVFEATIIPAFNLYVGNTPTSQQVLFHCRVLLQFLSGLWLF